MEWIDGASPRLRARLAGLVYLLFFLTSVVGAIVAPAVSELGGVSGDAGATAKYIITHEASVRVAIALGLVSTACYVALMALFYQLFRPVSRTFALLALVFGLVGSAITGFGSLFQVAPLVVLKGDTYLSIFDARQLQALALLFLNLNVQLGSIALVFFGAFQLALGYLIIRSTFLPRFLGVLIALAGLGWLVFLAPPLANALLTYLEVLGFAAEASLMLWLLVLGVNEQRWTEQAARNKYQSLAP
ncbi:MAG TPA: DUF4386 domain-containing protein [Candidatus Dormibacteraeota bacterium]|nr:DUF4386 domain-containing protein [Candidatus Dormibacteraeota bacterium]